MDVRSSKSSLSTTVSDQNLLNWLGKVHHAVLVVDNAGTMQWASAGFNLLCHGIQDRSERPFREAFAEQEQADEWNRILLEQGRIQDFPAVFADANGETVELQLNASILGGDASKPLTVVVARKPGLSSNDSRQRQEPPADLARAIINSSPDAVLTIDEGGFITHVNMAFEQLIDVRAEDIVNQPIGILVGHTSKGNLKRVISSVQPNETGRVYGQHLKFRRKDGDIVYLSISASDLISPGENFGGSVIFIRDVTERIRIQKQLEAKNTELENYVHTVSHDLRSPLVALLGFTKLLHREYGERLDETGLHFLDRIEQASRNMELLINHLLEFSRIGGVVETKSPTNVLEILEHLKAELKPRFEANDCALELPESGPLMLCDPTLMYQVLSNLLGNAVDHMSEASPAIVSVEFREDPTEHRISVRDNGQGIDSKDHERIFEIFQSLNRRADGSRGTGIGLAIVKKIAEAHGGRVWLESSPGEGACFHLALPR